MLLLEENQMEYFEAIYYSWQSLYHREMMPEGKVRGRFHHLSPDEREKPGNEGDVLHRLNRCRLEDMDIRLPDPNVL